MTSVVQKRRLDQLLSNLGYCSRREARAFLDAGRVTVSGRPAVDPGAKVNPGDVRVDGAPLDHPDGILLLLNKPTGLVCSHDPGEGPSVYDLLPERWRRRNPPVVSIGRLDKETSGVLLLTDRSELVHRLTSPRHKVPKLYRAAVDRDAPADLPGRFAAGIQLAGEAEPCLPAQARIAGPREVEVSVLEGRYHQVRRMFAACGLTVVALHRLAFAGQESAGLQPGQWRELELALFALPKP